VSDRPSGTGIRSILRSCGSSGPADGADLELHPTVTSALDAAVRYLRGLDTRGLRLAIDVGEVDLDSGVPAPAVDARSLALLDAASSGQLLVTGRAASVVADVPDGIVLQDLGRHRFHGVAAPIRVVEGRGDGLVSAVIRTLDTTAPSVPRPPTPLVGRSELLSDLVAAVVDERVVTLTGSGGSGKSRLAVEVALVGAPRFDAVHWVELAPLGRSEALIDELAAVVGAHHVESEGRREVLLAALRQGARLVVLDNAEHLIDAAAPLIAEAVRRCPELHVLVTSREPLGIAAEAVRRVPPLGVPARDAAPATIAASDSVVFLLDRLGRAGVDPPLCAGTLAQLHHICLRLDGIPLALELAAARASTLSLDELAAGLDDRFTLLSATRRGTQPHQRTLEASVRWSHDLLSARERTTFRRLAVFSGSFDAADVLEVDGGIVGHVADALDRLIERSLVAPSGDGRLRLLETVRAFAEDRLEESGETLAVRDRHLAWVLARTERLAPAFDGPDPAAAASCVRRLLNDVRAAIDHAEKSGRSDAMWSLIGLVANYCFYDGHLDEALAWAERAEALDDDGDPAVAAPGLVATALLATSRGDHDQIARLLELARATAESIDDRTSLGRALLLGAAHDSWHRPFEAFPTLAEGSDLCAAAGDLVWAAWGDCGAALALTFLGRPADALALLDEADAAATALRSRRLALDAAARRSICEYQLGFWADARRTVERGRDLADGFTAISVTACFDAVSAWLAIDAGGGTAAISAMDDAIERYLRAGELQFIPLFVDARARAMVSVGSPVEAIRALRAIRAHPGVEWSSIYRHWLDHTLVVALLDDEEYDGARQIGERLVEDATDVGNRLDAARGQLLLARLDERDGEVVRAESRLDSAIDQLWQLRAIPALLDALQASADRHQRAGRVDRAQVIGAGVRDARADLLEGAVPDLADLVEIVRRGRGDRRRPTFGWDSLTPTERRVVELVADGLTNPQIAERMIIGRATVKTHVSNVLRKLDLTGRTQLATAYRRRVGEHASARGTEPMVRGRRRGGRRRP